MFLKTLKTYREKKLRENGYLENPKNSIFVCKNQVKIIVCSNIFRFQANKL